jgi:ABC-2 type transport system ATP-binding protein/lipopolysaccharide transport system ATP-binding protein
MLRLTFAVATCFEPEIILMDEWIMAGDSSFLAKAEHRLRTFLGRASILVLATHNLKIAEQWCTHGLWLDRGQVKLFGEIGDVTKAYGKVG